MKTKSRTTRLLVGVFVLVLLAVTLVPLAWVVISSFKTQGEMLITPWALPKDGSSPTTRRRGSGASSCS